LSDYLDLALLMVITFDGRRIAAAARGDSDVAKLATVAASLLAAPSPPRA
jgi:hypothetical protein